MVDQLQKKHGISIIQIVREEYEMILLQKLYESSLSKSLVFRGGTALRLAYNSPRYSDDLDFSLLDKIKENDFIRLCNEISRDNENIELIEALKKYYTLYAKFRIQDQRLPQSIGIKFEISTREEEWEKEKDYVLRTIKSEVTPLLVLSYVASLERILKEKQAISPLRTRDVFDMWFIGQLLGKDITLQLGEFSRKDIKRDLFKLLPKDKQKLIEPWLSKD